MNHPHFTFACTLAAVLAAWQTAGTDCNGENFRSPRAATWRSASEQTQVPPSGCPFGPCGQPLVAREPQADSGSDTDRASSRPGGELLRRAQMALFGGALGRLDGFGEAHLQPGRPLVVVPAEREVQTPAVDDRYDVERVYRYENSYGFGTSEADLNVVLTDAGKKTGESGPEAEEEVAVTDGAKNFSYEDVFGYEAAYGYGGCFEAAYGVCAERNQQCEYDYQDNPQSGTQGEQSSSAAANEEATESPGASSTGWYDLYEYEYEYAYGEESLAPPVETRGDDEASWYEEVESAWMNGESDARAEPAADECVEDGDCDEPYDYQEHGYGEYGYGEYAYEPYDYEPYGCEAYGDGQYCVEADHDARNPSGFEREYAAEGYQYAEDYAYDDGLPGSRHVSTASDAQPGIGDSRDNGGYHYGLEECEAYADEFEYPYDYEYGYDYEAAIIRKQPPASFAERYPATAGWISWLWELGEAATAKRWISAEEIADSLDHLLRHLREQANLAAIQQQRERQAEREALLSMAETLKDAGVALQGLSKRLEHLAQQQELFETAELPEGEQESRRE